MSVKELATNPKIGAIVGATTAGTGIWTILDWIPTDIGKAATIVGIVLSLVLIYTHLRKGRAEVKKLKLETKILLHDLAARQKIDADKREAIDIKEPIEPNTKNKTPVPEIDKLFDSYVKHQANSKNPENLL